MLTRKGRRIHKLELTNFMDFVKNNAKPNMILHSNHACPKIKGAVHLSGYNPVWSKMTFKIGRAWYAECNINEVRKCSCYERD